MVRKEISSVWGQGDEQRDGEKRMDSRECVGKCLSTLGDVLGVGGKGKEV